MSANGNGDDGDSGPGTREVAYRLFAAEFDDCDFQFSESDEERAPNYVITPTGGRVNRMFLTGVLTELEQVNETMLRARIVDPTGAFVVYAGQYQPEALSFLERTEPPAFLAVTGKARTYQPDDSEVVYSSVRPESISEVDADTRDRWVVSTAEQTLDRIGVMAAAIDTGLSGAELRERLESGGVDPSLAQGVALARDHYGTTPAYLDALRDLALDATRVVADERDEAGSLDLAPAEGGPADLDGLRAGGPEIGTVAGEETASVSGTATAESAGTTESTATAEPDTTAESESATEPEASTTAETDTGVESESTPDTGQSEPADSSVDVESSADASATTADEQGSTADEPTADAAAETGAVADTGAADDEIGEFEPGELDAEEPEEDPLGEDVREQVEEEYGTEFATGSEVESEPDLEPEASTEPPAESEGTGGSEPSAEPESEPEPEAAEEPAAEEPADHAEDVDLSEAVMDAMDDLDEGDGAPTDAVIDRVVDRTGAGADEVDEAVQDALMGGQCYEPEDGKLKPI